MHSIARRMLDAVRRRRDQVEAALQRDGNRDGHGGVMRCRRCLPGWCASDAPNPYRHGVRAQPDTCDIAVVPDASRRAYAVATSPVAKAAAMPGHRRRMRVTNCS
ncbi:MULTISPECIES: hypothetical protein [unclassified Xanthomonas]|uniref:hypothetical protein n=1 Tax=Xanthomonas sp. LMG 8992 TaxID=1591157 RepID=UPI00136EA30F|nr:hypothetical protein [Xanthomonas sp. LMG 8992]